MRITFLSPPPNLSGGERVISTYAKRLANRGHEVKVICSQPRQPAWSCCFKDLLKGRGWPSAVPIGNSHYENDAIDYRIVDHRGALVDANIPPSDAIIATHWTTAEWLAGVNGRGAAKMYFVQGDEAGVLDYQPLVDRARATWALPFYKIVVCEWLLDLPGFRERPRARVVPNSVNLDLFATPRRRKQPVPTVGFMYSAAFFKGPDVALAAIDYLRKEIANLRIVVFGQSHPDALLPLPSGAEFSYQPSQRKLAALYAECDCWLFPSRYEGFGLPILEAMASRTPVAATEAGAAPDLLSMGGGRLVPVDDPKSLAKAAAEILCLEENAWAAVSDEAYRLAASYTWDDATNHFETAVFAAVEGRWHELSHENCPERTVSGMDLDNV